MMCKEREKGKREKGEEGKAGSAWEHGLRVFVVKYPFFPLCGGWCLLSDCVTVSSMHIRIIAHHRVAEVLSLRRARRLLEDWKSGLGVL